MKYKRVLLSISKPKENIFLDFISYLMKNCLKYWRKPKIHKLCNDILINAFKESDN